MEQLTIIRVFWGGQQRATLTTDQYEGYLDTLKREHPEVKDVHFEASVAFRKASGE